MRGARTGGGGGGGRVAVVVGRALAPLPVGQQADRSLGAAAPAIAGWPGDGRDGYAGNGVAAGAVDRVDQLFLLDARLFDLAQGSTQSVAQLLVAGLGGDLV